MVNSDTTHASKINKHISNEQTRGMPCACIYQQDNGADTMEKDHRVTNDVDGCG